jgi:hypothetical protein
MNRLTNPSAQTAEGSFPRCTEAEEVFFEERNIKEYACLPA